MVRDDAKKTNQVKIMASKMTMIIAVAAIALVAVAGAAVFMLNNNDNSKTINTIDDLKGATIGVENGTTGDHFATEMYEKTGDATVKRYTTYPDLVMDLKNKKIDAIIMDKAPAQAYVKKNSGIKILDAKLDTEAEEYAFVFKLSNTALKAQFDTALAQLKEEGKIAEIEEYWSQHLDGSADPYIAETGTGSTIKVGTSPDFPPYDAMYGTKFTGIDMDIVRAICNKLDLQVQFINYDFDSIINAVEASAIDVGASGFSVTPERATQVLFSDAYTTTEQVVVVRA